MLGCLTITIPSQEPLHHLAAPSMDYAKNVFSSMLLTVSLRFEDTYSDLQTIHLFQHDTRRLCLFTWIFLLLTSRGAVSTAGPYSEFARCARATCQTAQCAFCRSPGGC